MLINSAGSLYATKTDVNLSFRTQKQELSSFFILLIKFKAGSMFQSVISHLSPIPDTNPKSVAMTCSQSRSESDPSISRASLYFSCTFSFQAHWSWAPSKSSCSRQFRHTSLCSATHSLSSGYPTTALETPILIEHQVLLLSVLLFLPWLFSGEPVCMPERNPWPCLYPLCSAHGLTIPQTLSNSSLSPSLPIDPLCSYSLMTPIVKVTPV